MQEWRWEIRPKEIYHLFLNKLRLHQKRERSDLQKASEESRYKTKPWYSYVGTLGLALGTVVACRADFATASSVSLGVSPSELSGVVGLEFAVEKEGRRREDNDGDGGRGVGGRL